MERRLSAILAADVVGYTRMMGTDEAGTLDALKAMRAEVVDPKVAEHQGRVVKLTGDGILAEFPSVVNAVACAAAIQMDMRNRNSDTPRQRQFQFRIAVDLGDVIVEGDDIYGDGVNVAVRLQSVAKPGGIVTSQSVRDQIGNRLDIAFEDYGEKKLKNIDRPVRVYEVALSGSASRSGREREDIKPSVAVLPFTNMSGDPEQEYFSDGITEDIITDLSKISGLFVVARNTAFTFKGRPINLQQAGRELGVDFLLEGSVRKVGTRVRVSSQLVNSEDGGYLWAERFDRKALSLNDQLAEAHASRGLALSIEKRFEESTAEFDRAMELDPNSFEAHYLSARSSFTQGKFERAAELFERAAQISPEDHQSLILLIQIYRSLGRDSEKYNAARRAIERIERELVLHPEDPRPAYMGIAALIELGENDRAREWIGRALVVGADDPLTQYNVACGYTKLGDTEEALDLLERMLPKVGEEIKMWIKHDSDFEALHGHPRFQRLLKSIT
jgi:adenylate cyclase